MRVAIATKGGTVLEEGRVFMHRALVVLGEVRVAALADLLTGLVDTASTATNDSKATIKESAGYGR